MSRAAFIYDEIEGFRKEALRLKIESCAAGFVYPSGSSTRPRYLVRDLKAVPEAAYQDRSATRAVLTPDYCMQMANEARQRGAGVFLGHTHVGAEPLDGFSDVDDDGERLLLEYFGRRVPERSHLAGLVTSIGIRCRYLGQQKELPTERIGSAVVREAEAAGGLGADLYDRQIRAFGEDGQRQLQQCSIAIVGLGGTGSIVAQELAHLGVCRFTLIDSDRVETTNLNRIIGSNASDVGATKVEVAAHAIQHINSAATAQLLVGDVVRKSIAARLLDVDFIFVCTDSHASRAVVNQIAYQHLIPCIDMGVAIHTKDHAITHVVGRVQMLSAGLPCLVCGNWIDASQVRLEMMTDTQRAQDPYFVGVGVPQPAVVSLNGTVASLAVTMALSALTGFPADARLLVYDAVRGTVRPTVASRNLNCIVCSAAGSLARGNLWPLPTRADESNV